MEERKGIQLTDEQVEIVSEVLGENLPDEVKHLREIQEDDTPFPFNTIQKDGIISQEGYVCVNPNTGEKDFSQSAPGNADVSLSDIVEQVTEEKINEKLLNSEELKSNIKDGLDLSDDDVIKLLGVMQKTNNKEKINLLSELPTPMVQMAYQLAGTTDLRIVNRAAKDLFEFFMNQIRTEDTFIDFQEALRKELDIPGLVDMYAEHEIDFLEVELEKKAQMIEEKHPVKAKQFREIANMHKTAREFTALKNALKENLLAGKRLDKEIRKYKKYCSDFNYKYANSKFKIKDINLIAKALDRHLPEKYTKEDIEKIIVLICRISLNMKSDNPVDHTFMYYTINNILMLEHLQMDNQYYIELIKNIKEVLELIKNKADLELNNKQ